MNNSSPKILAFAGSLRNASLNKKLVKVAVEGAKEAGADVTLVDLRDYPLPIYDQEIQDAQGIPENAMKLRQLMLESDGFLLSCPEYNSSISGVLKNTIDWISRADLTPFTDKFIVLMSASPGQLGGMRCLVHVRQILSNINSIVLPKQKSVPGADKVFDENGNIKDPKLNDEIKYLGNYLTNFIKQHKYH